MKGHNIFFDENLEKMSKNYLQLIFSSPTMVPKSYHVGKEIKILHAIHMSWVQVCQQ